MKTFFYSVKKSNCDNSCRWQDCPQRYLAKLREFDGHKDIQTIFGKVSYSSPLLDATPRHGDIIILYAENTVEIDAMIAGREGFDGLKKILVVADPAGVDGDKYHMLAPRYITQAQRDIGELAAVLRKMNGHIH